MRNSQKLTKKKIIAFAVAAVVAAISYFSSEILPKFQRANVGKEQIPVSELCDDGHILVHYIDVGQGDSTLIETTEGNFVLIDAGTNDCEKKLVSYLDSRNVEEIEYLILTHPHEDHIGSADAVVENFTVKNVVKNSKDDDSTDTQRLERAVKNSSKENGTKTTVANTGDKFTLDGIEFLILSDGDEYGDYNDSSICIRMEYGKSTFIFTGDAGAGVERDIISGDYDISAEVLKCGHHGSSTSNSEDFLGKVNPDIAIVSCERGNSYGHPHNEVLESIDDRNITLYRTDLDGDIVLRCSEKQINYVEFD